MDSEPDLAEAVGVGIVVGVDTDLACAGEAVAGRIVDTAAVNGLSIGPGKAFESHTK